MASAVSAAELHAVYVQSLKAVAKKLDLQKQWYMSTSVQSRGGNSVMTDWKQVICEGAGNVSGALPWGEHHQACLS